ncbi:MAG: acyloxyacyl hydrolase [Pyrinomonadaceae bacterium]|nr:acyloxyacyl hydrolase [Pyrinomonadaceae bacterium]
MRNFFADFRRVIIFLTITAVFSMTALAQNFNDGQKNNSAVEDVSGAKQTANALNDKNEFSVWGAFAPDIPRLFSGSRPSTFGEFGFQYARRIASSRNVALKYTIDAIPLAVINYRQERLIRLSPTAFGYERPRTTAYAAGLTPVGFQLNFLRQRKIQPFVTANAGLLIFNKSLPDDRSALRPEQRGRQFNYTLAGGGGVEFLTDANKSYTVGFKFHHISNASTGNINPGFDQNLFYFGYTFKKF